MGELSGRLVGRYLAIPLLTILSTEIPIMFVNVLIIDI